MIVFGVLLFEETGESVLIGIVMVLDRLGLIIMEQ